MAAGTGVSTDVSSPLSRSDFFHAFHILDQLESGKRRRFFRTFLASCCHTFRLVQKYFAY